MITQKQRLGTL